MADPFSVVTNLVGVVRYLKDAADKARQNKAECQRLAAHTETISELIVKECANGVPPELEVRMEGLTRCVV